MLLRRYLYVLMFAVPAALVSLVAAAVTAAALAGALWLFVFGDNPWPPAANTLLGGVAVLVGACLTVGLLAGAYVVGKGQEARTSLHRGHVLLAVGVTVAFGALIVSRTMGLGVAGARSDSLICADLCRAEGFPGSGVPPRDSGDRTCTCYDSGGGEARQFPLDAGRSR